MINPNATRYGCMGKPLQATLGYYASMTISSCYYLVPTTLWNHTSLIYDCKFEAKAEDKLRHPEIELPEEYATVEFRFHNRRREGHYSHAMEMEMGIEVLEDEEKLRIINDQSQSNPVRMLGSTSGEQATTALYL
ncbi:hypothetical protein OESDEN_07396 [Oesophagostomum dentatum]|uniref:Uncharacterized protein n=1 Tax=Oesophagostomum dentatum TaxID=61180 RepID=A0A0B1T9A6_OESDE|nr:hypothetical protein OESDEN_07396 [Oesophagostomum dentatum]